MRGAPSPAARLAALVLASVAIGLVSLAAGPHRCAWPWSGDLEAEIVWRIRLPRVCLGFLAGGTLAASGMAFQALFRNALATPFTLGVSSGASLGAAVYVVSGWSAAPAGISGQSLAAMIGALVAILLVYGLTRASRGFTSSTLLLAGVAVSFLFTSLLSALAYVGDASAHLRIGRWLMGGLEVVGFAVVRQLLPFAAMGLAAIVFLRRELDLLLLGDDVAAARGVPVGRIQKLLFLGVSLMVGGAVAACGPIGFVGLIVPHVGRRLVGAGHARLAPFCILAGGAFLVLCDTLGRTVLAPTEVPVGLVTSLLGGPFFLALLVRGRAEPAGLDL